MKSQTTHLATLWQVSTYLQELGFTYFTAFFSPAPTTFLCLTSAPGGWDESLLLKPSPASPRFGCARCRRALPGGGGNRVAGAARTPRAGGAAPALGTSASRGAGRQVPAELHLGVRPKDTCSVGCASHGGRRCRGAKRAALCRGEARARVGKVGNPVRAAAGRLNC